MVLTTSTDELTSTAKDLLDYTENLIIIDNLMNWQLGDHIVP